MKQGEIIKLKIDWSWSGDDSLTLLDCSDVEVRFFCNPLFSVTLTADDLINDGGDIIAYVDTAKTGAGVLKMEVKAKVPDPNFGNRLTVNVCETEIPITD